MIYGKLMTDSKDVFLRMGLRWDKRSAGAVAEMMQWHVLTPHSEQLKEDVNSANFLVI